MSSATETRLVLGKSIALTSNEGDTYLSALITSKETPERDIINLIIACCNQDSCMLDVGANIGYVSIAMSMLAPKGKILSFEPAPKIFSFLKKNLKDNGIKNVKIHNIGLSDKDYKTLISYASGNPSGAFVSKKLAKNKHVDAIESIQLKALDSLYEQLGISKCDLLKVDIEGHEPNFLRGAQKFIAKFKPLTIMEVNHWCLNVFNRVSLPDFIDLAYAHFPHIFAFNYGDFLDLSDNDSRYLFFYDNVVNNKFMNLFCGFDKNKMLRSLDYAFGDGIKTLGSINTDLGERCANLELTNSKLTELCDSLEASKSHRLAKKINNALGR